MDNIFIDLLMAELNRTQQLKSDLESKAAGCLTAVALIMSLLGTFMVHLCDSHHLGAAFAVCMSVFCIGLLLVIMFALILFPRRMDYLSADALLKFYNSAISDNEKINHIFSEITKTVTRNKGVLKKIRWQNWGLCVGMVVLACGFVCASIMFFCVCKGWES